MTTALIFTAPNDLAATALGEDSIQLDWSAATPIYVPMNLGAESGSMAGWTSTLGAVAARSPVFNPKQGTWVFDGGSVARSISVQRISPLSLGLLLADIAGGKDLTLKYWPGSMDLTASESARVSLYAYDESGSLLGSHIPSYVNAGVPASTSPPSVKWGAEQTEVFAMPAGTCFIDFEIDLKRNNGVGNNAVIEDIRFTLEDATTDVVPGYAIYRDGVLIATVGANAVTFTDTSLDSGTSYSYKVLVYDPDANVLSDFSNTVVQATDGEDQFVFGAFAPAQTFAPASLGVSGFGASFLNGAFAGARAFTPVMIANMRGARPRIYMPLENVTVRTGR